MTLPLFEKTDAYFPKVKSDNAELPSKVFLRRVVIEEGRLGPLCVADLFAGRGVIWDAMREFVPVETYTPFDINPRQLGTIKADSTDPRFLDRLDLSVFNVIDIDTYGHPWATWMALAPRISRRTAVFMTDGHIARGGGSPMGAAGPLRSALGIPPGWGSVQLPQSPELSALTARCCLHAGLKGLTLVSGLWMPTEEGPSQGCDYYGLLVEPKS